MWVAWSREMAPVCIAVARSGDDSNTLPVVTTACALPTDVPVVLATTEASSTLRATAATPNAATFSARA